MTNPQASLPPGFRFHPTDEELILHYLQKKASSIPLPVSIIAEVDIYKFNPWDLPAMAAFGEKEWYFLTPRDRKYPNGARPNRAAASGYWKATGTDKVITNTSRMGARNENVGVKKALVFYMGRPPKGAKTNWIMHEYRLTESLCTVHPTNRPSTPMLKESSMRLDDWVLCRIYKKSNTMSSASAVIPPINPDHEAEERCINAQGTELPSLTSLPGNTNTGIGNNLLSQKSPSFSNLIDLADFTMLSSFLYDNNVHLNTLSCLESPNSTHTVIPNIDHSNHIAPTTSPSVPVIQNVLKRQRLGIYADMPPPSKKFSGSTCSFPTSDAVGIQFDVPEHYNYTFNNHSFSFLNQQLLLSPNAPFPG